MAETRAVYRSLLRTAAQMPQYNFRAYASRRITEEFRRPHPPTALKEAYDTLAILRRQVAVATLYPPPELVVEHH